MKQRECVSFILLKDKQVLLEKRAIDKATDPGLITIPGGHIEQGETQLQALVRELDEELTIAPIQYHYLCSLYHPTCELQLIHYYVISKWQGELTALEAETVQWYPVDSAPVGIEADSIALQEIKRVLHCL
ncbi:NUDIX hydrolase [Vibrio atypicus]|uniref:NUDIX hydrolase n=1 Tax=Vibrio atypicus TaxID=558271 RepID=UPI0013578EC8|nr:NUDIX domain-containing protein [Vibrio atypicus]